MIGGLPSQLRLRAWRHELNSDNTHTDLNAFILQGVKYGFAIVDNTDIPSYCMSNYKSATQGDAKLKFDELFKTELKEFKLLNVDVMPHCVHALGAVPKGKHEFRPITDCKRPLAVSINNFMNSTYSYFKFQTLDDVCASLKPNMFMASVDIAAAYRSVSVRADHWKYQGVCWKFSDQEGSQYMQDTRLCFGLRCAPYIFSVISDSIVRMKARRGFPHVYSYLDDFLVLGDSFHSCQLAQKNLIRLLISLAFCISWKKCSTPQQQCKYLGIWMDSVQMKLIMPQEKLEKFQKEMKFFQGKNRATKRQLQRLCGILNHCSRVVRGGSYIQS